MKSSGKLKLIKLERIKGIAHYHCLCECGKEVFASWGNIQQGVTKSCGCLRKEVTSKRKTKPLKEVITTQIWNYYKRNAKYRNIDWNLDKETFQNLIFSPCFYCGDPAGTITNTTWAFKTNNLKRSMPNNGVDRKNNKEGYNKRNCVSCCKTCNFAKNNLSHEDFMKWIKRITKYQMEKNI